MSGGTVVKISIFGLGYVGSVSCACFAKLGHEVVGVDVNPMKVFLINKGQSPVIETGLEELISIVVKNQKLRATTDAQSAVKETDLSIVCVGTPSASNGNLELSYVKRVCENIGQAIKEKDTYHLIIIRSTILPGTVERIVIPTLENESGKRVGEDFGVCFNPEFLRESTAIKDFYNPPFTLIGQHDEKAGKKAADLYKDINAPLRIVAIKEAEMVKYANNAFHGLKVTFANEIGNICKQLNIDSHTVMDIFCMDNKLNLSPYYLKPGFAFGGSCLPKDLRALLYRAHRLDISVPVLEAILPANNQQVKMAFNMVRATEKKKVGFLGFSFKAGTDDLRESPIVELIERLIGKGYQVKVYDQNVTLARLHGANRAYIEREIPHIASLMCDAPHEILEDTEVIIVGNKGDGFADILKRASAKHTIIDLVRIIKPGTKLNAEYNGICW